MEMRFRREMSALSSLMAMSEEFCRLNDLEGQNRATVDFVLEELFTNSVKYGSQNEGEVLIVLDQFQGELHLSFTDLDADRFDPREAPEADIDLPLEERKPGGLGIHLIKQLADRIEYDHHDRTSKITIYKRLE
jgi:anti-sigma regulatory factor (Ser/Thr protein kinase)